MGVVEKAIAGAGAPTIGGPGSGNTGMLLISVDGIDDLPPGKEPGVQA